MYIFKICCIFCFYYCFLFSVNLLHVDMVAFPINPVFMFPLTILFLGFLLEFSENQNKYLFPLMFLIITLAIQIHYSAATYYLAPIVVALFFKIRNPVRIVLATAAVIIICFIPYFFYKTHTLEPDTNTQKLFFHLNITSVSEVLRILTVQNTIDRIAFRQGAEPVFTSPPIYSVTNYFF